MATLKPLIIWRFFLGLIICTIIVVVNEVHNGNNEGSQPPKAVITLHNLNKNGSQRPVVKNNLHDGNKKVTQPPWRDPDFEKITSNSSLGLGQLSEKEIIILHWTKFYGFLRPALVLESHNCSILKTGTTRQLPISRIFDKPCRITHDHRYLNVSHAVVFHSPDMLISGTRRPSLPKPPRPQNQIWIWFEGEAPPFEDVDMNECHNIFNWTMTYRRDSDVCFPPGYIFRRNISDHRTTSPQPTAQENSPDHDHYRKSLKMKSGLAAWIVSTCVTSSKRENFVKELQKYIPVDIFGTCGKKPCPLLQNKGYFKCYDHIQSKYKFYLSFENSLCLDYLTEKFYLALKTNMVPVVYGGGIDDRMDYLSIAPQNSFIDARKFKSSKDLANYLIYLDKNDDEYLKYFEWKAKYQVEFADYPEYKLGWCNLCQRLFEHLESGEKDVGNKWYSDLHTWWNYKGEFNATAQLKLSPPASQSKSTVGLLGQTFQKDMEKLKPTCVQPKVNFTSYSKNL